MSTSVNRNTIFPTNYMKEFFNNLLGVDFSY